MVSGTRAASPSTGIAPPAGKRAAAKSASTSRSLARRPSTSAAEKPEAIASLPIAVEVPGCADHLLALEHVERSGVRVEQRERPCVVLQTGDDDRVARGALAIVEDRVGLDTATTGRARHRA